MGTTVDETDAVAYVGRAMRGRLDDLALLTRTADSGLREGTNDDLESLGFDLDEDDLEDQATILLDEYPLCVEATTTFEIVLGTGGPDDRLLIECETIENRCRDERDHADYEIRRILYRYSWSGSGERVLSGEDYDVAERFARRVVPELVE